MRKLDDLAQLMELKYQRDQDALLRVVAEETRLRRAIATLREQASSADKDTEMNRMGADVVWRQWAGQAQSDINTRLAAILAQKEQLLVHARRAFGRVQVAKTLAEQSAEADRTERNSKRLNRQIELCNLLRSLR